MSNIRLFFKESLSLNLTAVKLSDKLSLKNNLILLINVKLIYEKY